MIIMKNIGPFKLYTKEPNDIHYGKLYTMEVELPILYSKKRTIRLYIPEDFDPNKKYPVIFMADGQNIVDKYTSAFGAWSVDVHEHNLIKEGKRSFIVVGIDCPVNPIHRALEYSFPFIPISTKETGDYNKENLEFESHLLYKYIALELLPLVRKHLPISEKKEDIGTGGSSMGGVFSTSLLTSYPDIFGFALIFSPGYFLYPKDLMRKYIDEHFPKLNNHRLYFYTGTVGFEARFVEETRSTYDYLLEKGFNKENIKLVIDQKSTHNEEAWSKHFEDAIIFLIK